MHRLEDPDSAMHELVVLRPIWFLISEGRTDETYEFKSHRISDWKKLSERLVSLGIMGDQFRTPLNPSIRQSDVMFWRVSGGPSIGPHDAERRQFHG